MRERKVLMLAYPFPPMGRSGTFRVLRFVKYLPDFGWRPLVVTIRPEELPEYGLDTSVSGEVPAATVVRRTCVLHPLRSMIRAAKALIARRSVGPAADVRSSLRTCGTVDRAPKKMSRLRTTLRATYDLLCATPDAAVGWFLPALWSALSRATIPTERGLLDRAAPQQSSCRNHAQSDDGAARGA